MNPYYNNQLQGQGLQPVPSPQHVTVMGNGAGGQTMLAAQGAQPVQVIPQGLLARPVQQLQFYAAGAPLVQNYPVQSTLTPPPTLQNKHSTPPPALQQPASMPPAVSSLASNLASTGTLPSSSVQMPEVTSSFSTSFNVAAPVFTPLPTTNKVINISPSVHTNIAANTTHNHLGSGGATSYVAEASPGASALAPRVKKPLPIVKPSDAEKKNGTKANGSIAVDEMNNTKGSSVDQANISIPDDLMDEVWNDDDDASFQQEFDSIKNQFQASVAQSNSNIYSAASAGYSATSAGYSAASAGYSTASAGYSTASAVPATKWSAANLSSVNESFLSNISSTQPDILLASSSAQNRSIGSHIYAPACMNATQTQTEIITSVDRHCNTDTVSTLERGVMTSVIQKDAATITRTPCKHTATLTEENEESVSAAKEQERIESLQTIKERDWAFEELQYQAALAVIDMQSLQAKGLAKRQKKARLEKERTKLIKIHEANVEMINKAKTMQDLHDFCIYDASKIKLDVKGFAAALDPKSDQESMASATSMTSLSTVGDQNSPTPNDVDVAQLTNVCCEKLMLSLGQTEPTLLLYPEMLLETARKQLTLQLTLRNFDLIASVLDLERYEVDALYQSMIEQYRQRPDYLQVVSKWELMASNKKSNSFVSQPSTEQADLLGLSSASLGLAGASSASAIHGPPGAPLGLPGTSSVPGAAVGLPASLTAMPGASRVTSTVGLHQQTTANVPGLTVPAGANVPGLRVPRLPVPAAANVPGLSVPATDIKYADVPGVPVPASTNVPGLPVPRLRGPAAANVPGMPVSASINVTGLSVPANTGLNHGTTAELSVDALQKMLHEQQLLAAQQTGTGAVSIASQIAVNPSQSILNAAQGALNMSNNPMSNNIPVAKTQASTPVNYESARQTPASMVGSEHSSHLSSKHSHTSLNSLDNVAPAMPDDARTNLSAMVSIQKHAADGEQEEAVIYEDIQDSSKTDTSSYHTVLPEHDVVPPPPAMTAYRKPQLIQSDKPQHSAMLPDPSVDPIRGQGDMESLRKHEDSMRRLKDTDTSIVSATSTHAHEKSSMSVASTSGAGKLETKSAANESHDTSMAFGKATSCGAVFGVDDGYDEGEDEDWVLPPATGNSKPKSLPEPQQEVEISEPSSSDEQDMPKSTSDSTSKQTRTTANDSSASGTKNWTPFMPSKPRQPEYQQSHLQTEWLDDVDESEQESSRRVKLTDLWKAEKLAQALEETKSGSSGATGGGNASGGGSKPLSLNHPAMRVRGTRNFSGLDDVDDELAGTDATSLDAISGLEDMDGWQSVKSAKDKGAKKAAKKPATQTTKPTPAKSSTGTATKIDNYELLLEKVTNVTVPLMSRDEGEICLRVVKESHNGSLAGISLPQIVQEAGEVYKKRLAAKGIARPQGLHTQPHKPSVQGGVKTLSEAVAEKKAAEATSTQTKKKVPSGSTGSGTAPSSTTNLLYKTKVCTFWQQGQCQKGDACVYAHGANQIQEPPKIVCKNYLAGSCTFEEKCIFQHPAGAEGSKQHSTHPRFREGFTVLTSSKKSNTEATRPSTLTRGSSKPALPKVAPWAEASQNAKRMHQSSQANECTVCYELIAVKDCKTLDCGHKYHKACILRWLTQGKGGNTCPICREYTCMDDDFPLLG